jgi:predicted hotdog family 3-hydroxylacyl-ACP dehydratase
VPVGRDWIAAHIPHQGAMCLIDEVRAWDETSIECTTATHRLESNPMRTAHHLRSECGIEYAAQAIAIHGALRAPPGHAPLAGMLASARDVVSLVARFDDLDADLVIHAIRISGDEGALLYAFSISCGARMLQAGRATVVLRRPSTTPIGAST